MQLWLLAVLQLSLWFDLAVDSGSCDQVVSDLYVVPIGGRLGCPPIGIPEHHHDINTGAAKTAS